MTKLSPLQRVKAEHGSKDELAAKVLALLDAREDEEQDEFEHRIRTMSNFKLLRLFEAHQRVSSEYGSREDLVNKIVSTRFPRGNDEYKVKISGYTVPKLLDLARQYKA